MKIPYLMTERWFRILLGLYLIRWIIQIGIISYGIWWYYS